jgi:translation initiation factor IF-1
VSASGTKGAKIAEKPVAPEKVFAYVPPPRFKNGEFLFIRVPGEDAIRLEGTLIEVLREATLFRVELANGHRLLGHVSVRRREEAAALKPGDKVNLLMTSFDFSKGRIVLEERKK